MEMILMLQDERWALASLPHLLYPTYALCVEESSALASRPTRVTRDLESS